MNTITKDQAREIVSAYDYYGDEEDFIEKLQNRFGLTEDEIRSIFKILDKAFIKWS